MVGMAKNLRKEKSPLDPSPAGREEVPLADFVPIVPDHELIRRIGEGSYGEVWLARNVVGTYRAVKVVYRKTFEHDRPYEREFGGMQKFEPVSRTHEGLVNVLQIGRNDQAGYFYYIMELADEASPDRSGREQPLSSRRGELSSTPPRELDGSAPWMDQDRSEPARTSAAPINPGTYKPKTLGEVGRHGRLSLQECVQIVLGVTSSLAHLHRHGLVHRDIKPSNILIINGVPKLADIGLVAGINETRSFVGTEGFIAPEGPGKPQADLYSLGKVLYEIGTGKDRHDFPDLPADLRDSADQTGFSEMNEIILKACASEVAQRYRSAEEMHAELALLQQGKSVKQKRVKERRWALTMRVGLSAVVLTTLVGVLLPLQRQWQAQRPMDPKGLELYTDGQVYLRKGTTKDMDVAIPLLEQALTLDQNHPKIHAALAWAYEKKFFFFAPTNRELDVKAGHALDRARQLGPKLPETHFANGYMLWYRPDSKGFQHEQAITSYRRALEANPHLAQENPMLAAESHQQLAVVYLHIGLMDEALEEAKKALEIDSVHSRFHYNGGLIALHRGDYRQAEEELRRGDIIEVGLNHADLALACFKQGKTNEAKNVIENALKESPTDPGGQFASVEAMLFARAGEFTRAKEAIQKAEQNGKGYGHFHHTAYNIGCAYALMNQPADAVRWLRTAADTGFPCYPEFQNDPTLANISRDSQFRKFLDELRNLWLGHKEFQRQLGAQSRM
jgi:serine/threonine protein kinase/Tfp pilus assembly protein PilF